MFEIFHTIFKYREKESPDKLGLYPERVHVNAMPERRYLWTSRILVILAAISMSINMMLALTVYLLVPQKEKNGRIYSPVESSKVQTRKVITKQEADTLIREIPAIQAAWVENEKLRENVYKEAIKSCDLRELVKIIKNMYLRRQERISSGKKATVLDDRYFKLAEDKLYSELVFATGKDRNQIEKQIEQQAAQCMESV